MLKAIIKELRIHQWIKNTFVLIPLVFDRQLFLVEPLTRTIIGFLLFCFVSSSVYLINDVMDVEADRLHPKKKNRPIASGELPIPLAITIATILVIGSFLGAYFLSFAFLIIFLMSEVQANFYLCCVPNNFKSDFV